MSARVVTEVDGSGGGYLAGRLGFSHPAAPLTPHPTTTKARGAAAAEGSGGDGGGGAMLSSSVHASQRSPARVRADSVPRSRAATTLVAAVNQDGICKSVTMSKMSAKPPLPPYTPPSLHLDSDAIKQARLHVGWRRGPRAWLAQSALSPWGKRVMRATLRLLHLLLWAPLTLVRARRPHRPLPPLAADHPLLRRSATELAELIRRRKVSSEAVVTAYARRVREVNPLLNAVVDERFAEAVAEARAADAEVEKAVAAAAATAAAEDDEKAAAAAALEAAARRLAQERPLLGVPVTVKESVAVKGLSHCAGQLSLGKRRATADAEAIVRLRAAGAIPLLASNCPELCMHYESFNRVTGRTRNPHDTRRTPGGSSGGEAALLGAGASVVGVGSDIGGSSRLPAMFTGVFGHKPTAGVVSDIGHWPRSEDSDWWRFFTLGPMTRYAEDMKLMLKIMANDEALTYLELDSKVNISELQVFYIENDGGITTEPIKPDILSGLHKAVQHLTSVCKIPPKKIYLKDLKYAMDLTGICLFRMKGIQNVFQVGNDPDEWRNASVEWIKYFLGMSQASFYALIYGPLKWIFGGVPADVVSKYINIIDRLRSQLEDMLQDNGVLLYPTFVRPAPFHGEMYFYFLSGMYCSIFNILQMPATNCPVGRSKCGLPIGIQIVAAPYRDRLSLAVAEELSKAFGGWIEPS